MTQPATTRSDRLTSMLPPVPPAPQPAQLTWLGCDLRTGRIAEELPALTPTGSLSRRLGAYTSAAFTLALAGAPAAWEAATDPGRTMLVALADEIPVWAGIVLTRSGGSAGTVQLGVATPEAYLDRRYARDHTWTQQDETSVIAAGLIGDTALDGIGLTIDAPAAGRVRDRAYRGADDATVLSRLQELMGVDGGPEWTIDVRWHSDTTRLELIARVRQRIGVQSASPAAVFTHPGDVAAYELFESYEAGRGATVVQARGEGEGDSRASSSETVAADLIASGWPRYEYRWTPGTAITSKNILDSHAQAALALLRPGARVWSVDAVATQAPRLGRDWQIGDNIRLQVLTSPRHPAGVDMAGRAWGWDWDPRADRISPILAEE
ncbi:hypothetical protein [Micromonospora sp. RTGN7]|uniref:hypothetical protein n=1 Tax=Micromonospora sp. RTGN7 TaxID=3016526 RepID=UPI0029FF42F4|nr:hypothetical protein [Micromonospora sp. RTGN7]